MHDALFPKYDMADGSQVFMYQARKVLADEVPFEVDAACPLPLSLPNVTRPLPPVAAVLASLLTPLHALPPPPPLKAPPPRCAHGGSLLNFEE